MKQRNLIALLAAVTMVAFGLASAAEAVTSLNSSRSNVYKTAPACTQAGGSWVKGREGLGCYMPLPAKPAAAGKTTPK